MELLTGLFARLSPDTDFARALVTVSRYVLPALAFWILLRCVLSMFRCRYEPEIWGYLKQSDGYKHPLLHWENLI
ncbi:MAG: hypothetical protein IKR07_03620, partial [Oscillospiraceae bacterium]|nr:hypothetical protein [Oscillospiraceae bacterium]